MQATGYPMAFQSTLPVWGGTGQYFGGRPVFHGFNPPSPCGEGRRLPMFLHSSSRVFQSTLPVWGGTVAKFAQRADRAKISIHPPRVGRDLDDLESSFDELHFNPPSPCGEGHLAQLFVSVGSDFNPPSPCGEGPLTSASDPEATYFNPPSPCGEGPEMFLPELISVKFQSTLPVWGGTAKAHKNSL